MKISVIMQSFLGDYPGSRTLPKEKFLRAVNSFLLQKHQDKELVIVADGCEITKKMYELYLADKEEIKFCYLHRNVEKEKSLYSQENNKISYRGLPREVGRAMATGDLITYFDTDDIMLSTRLSDLDTFWQNVPENVKWSSNPIRLINEKALTSDLFKERKTRIGTTSIPITNMGTKQTENFFINQTVAEGSVSGASYALCHRKDVKTKWKNFEIDKDDKTARSEDTLFLYEMQNEEGPGIRQESASIVICHYRGIWDV